MSSMIQKIKAKLKSFFTKIATKAKEPQESPKPPYMSEDVRDKMNLL